MTTGYSGKHATYGRAVDLPAAKRIANLIAFLIDDHDWDRVKFVGRGQTSTGSEQLRVTIDDEPVNITITRARGARK